MNAPTEILMRSKPCRIKVIEDLRFQLEQSGIDLLKVVKQAIVEKKHDGWKRKKRYLTYNPKTNMRICNKCKNELPWTTDNFYYANRQNKKLDFTCKLCRVIVNTANKRKSKIRICNVCGIPKALHSKNFSIFKKNVHTYYNKTCIQCVNEYQRKLKSIMLWGKKGELVHA